MNTTVQPGAPAWEPLTPRGVAAFARASLGRLLLVQFLVASLAAAMVVGFLRQAWFPVVRAAIRRLPAAAEIRDGRLAWPGDNPVMLADNHFLGLSVDLYHSGRLARESHLQIEFGAEEARIISLPGYRIAAYAPAGRLPFNREEVEPWWGAWEPGFLAAAGAAVVLGLMAAWAALATLYFLPLRLITFLADRDLNLRQSWRMSGALLMPGALFFTFALFGYAMQWVDLMGLAVLAALHLVIGWIYLVSGPWFLPRIALPPRARDHPFQSS